MAEQTLAFRSAWAQNLSGIEAILMSAAVVAVPFQNMDFQAGRLAVAGAQLSFFPLLGLLLISPVRIAAAWRGNAKDRRLVAVIGAFFLLVTLSSFMTVAALGTQGLAWPLLVHKYFSQTILYAVWLVAIFGVKVDRRLRWAFAVAFVVACLGAILSVYSASFNEASHSVILYAKNLNLRPRGFSREASDLALTIGGLGGILYLWSSPPFRLVVLGATSLLLAAIQSKGAAGAWLLAVAVAFCFRWIRGKDRATIVAEASAVALPFFGYYGYLLLAHSLAGSGHIGHGFGRYVSAVAEGSTTIGTRLTMAAFSMATLLHVPLGVGFFGLLPWVHAFLPQVIRVVSGLFPGFQYSEVISYSVSASGAFVSAKSLLFNGLILAGLPFLVLNLVVWWRFVRWVLKEGAGEILIPVVFALVSYSTYSGIENSYAPAFVLSLAYFYVRGRSEQ